MLYGLCVEPLCVNSICKLGFMLGYMFYVLSHYAQRFGQMLFRCLNDSSVQMRLRFNTVDLASSRVGQIWWILPNPNRDSISILLQIWMSTLPSLLPYPIEFQLHYTVTTWVSFSKISLSLYHCLSKFHCLYLCLCISTCLSHKICVLSYENPGFKEEIGNRFL